MKKTFKYLLAAAILGGALTISSTYAADATPTTPDKGRSQEAPAQAKPKRDWYPFGGTVAAVDKQANTISLKKKEGERVLKLDSKSTLEINGKPAVIGSVKVGNYAHGKLHKNGKGEEVILDAKFDKEAPSKKKPAVNDQAPKTPAPASKP